jgi:hypothetical protein
MEPGCSRISPAPSPTTTRHSIGTDNTNGTDNIGIPFTFILHKSAFDILPPTTKRAPSFAAFDHGDHIHIIFNVKHSNNAARHTNTITGFLKASFTGTTEAHRTLQQIKFPTRFISYLIRKGLRTFHKYGSRIIAILKPLSDALLQYDTTDTPDAALPCSQYIEERKQIKQETVTSRTFSIDYISGLITSNNISSYEMFQRVLPTETKFNY